MTIKNAENTLLLYGPPSSPPNA